MTKPTLLILAAGLGSRYGSFKQLIPLGPSGEAIIDYSVFDAIRAGFGKVVFVIKKELEQDFRESLLSRFENRIETGYVFQDLDMLPPGYSPPQSRKKPWGTGHAILVARAIVKTPFSVINADDFYGYGAFDTMRRFLSTESDDRTYAMVGYKLRNTLSEHGSVSRGVCEVDERGLLASVNEREKIIREQERITHENQGIKEYLSDDSLVSMNMWGFSLSLFEHLESHFSAFLDQNIDNNQAEFYIPTLVDKLITTGKAEVKVLQSDAKWFGITYQADRDIARQRLLQFVDKGVYPASLWS